LDISQLVDSELDIYGIFRYANTYPDAIQALSRSQLDICKIITHKYPLSQIKEALEVARTQKDSSIKIMIYPHGGEK
jgi:L-iditol 2-dehydrogenase